MRIRCCCEPTKVIGTRTLPFRPDGPCTVILGDELIHVDRYGSTIRQQPGMEPLLYRELAIKSH